ncbi:MAG: hypothetical protein ACFCUG_04620 [Thiotrichales bacterium]
MLASLTSGIPKPVSNVPIFPALLLQQPIDFIARRGVVWVHCGGNSLLELYTELGFEHDHPQLMFRLVTERREMRGR